jgi:chaperonin GroEL
MDGKIIKDGSVSQDEIIAGVKKTVGAIKTTLGPAGKSVALIDSNGYPEITRDGVTVARSINFKNQGENIGAELVKKAASLTESSSGDGTTTSSLLIGELCSRGQKAIRTGSNVNSIKSGMLKAGKWMESYIKSVSTPINGDFDLIKKVATISANNDSSIGNLVVEGMKKIGIGGLLLADTSFGLDTVIDITDGMKLDKGWSSPRYVTDPKSGECVMENAYVLIAGEKLSSINQISGIMKELIEHGNGRPILIICDSFDDIVNTALVYNTVNGIIRCCLVHGIDFGDGRKNIMNDVAISTGSVFFCPENGLSVSSATLDQLGYAKKVVVSRDSCIIYGGGGNPAEISELADVLRTRLSDPKSSDYDKEKFKKRLANLTGGVGIIKAGGATEVEKSNKKAIIEDSILSSKSAIEEGFVPGGGYVYLKGSQDYKKDKAFLKDLVGDELEGAEIVFSSLPCVIKTIVSNCGESGDVVVDKILSSKKFGFGFDAKSKKFGNLLEFGILDSAKVIRVALENSISTASMILLIDCTILDDPEDKALDN